MTKLIIFDCDGVLVDSEIVSHQVALDDLARIGYSITLEESIKKFTGKNAKTICDLIFEESGITITQDFWQKSQNTLLETFSKTLSPLIPDILMLLHDHSIARCVASSSHRERVCHALTVTQQLSYFSDHQIFTSQQVQRGKPAPDLFLFAAKIMGYKPQECLVIEDSPSGIEAALAAHIPVIAFLGGGHAQYKWYHERIKTYNIPIAYHPQELEILLSDQLSLITKKTVNLKIFLNR